jgi:histidinol-phosphatase (PHP family)
MYSADCRYNIERMTKEALNRKMKLIYVADHFELNQKPGHDMTFDLDEYRKEIQRVNRKINGIEVLAGLELGAEKSQFERFESIIKDSSLDMIILSTHKVNGVYLSDEKFYSEKHTLKIYEEYYSQILDNIRSFDNFDVVGHLDLIDKFKDRYYIDLEFSKYKNIVVDIIKEIIKRDKALEINTAGYHNILGRPYPKMEILTMYKRFGGEKIIIGSDAHIPDLIGYNHKLVINSLKNIGFSNISIYRKRIPHMVRL